MNEHNHHQEHSEPELCLCKRDQDGQCPKCLSAIMDYIGSLIKINLKAIEDVQELRKASEFSCDACRTRYFDLAVSRMLKDCSGKVDKEALVAIGATTLTMAKEKVPVMPLTQKFLNDLMGRKVVVADSTLGDDPENPGLSQQTLLELQEKAKKEEGDHPNVTKELNEGIQGATANFKSERELLGYVDCPGKLNPQCAGTEAPVYKNDPRARDYYRMECPNGHFMDLMPGGWDADIRKESRAGDASTEQKSE